MGSVNLKKRNICVLLTIVTVLLTIAYERNANRPSRYRQVVDLLTGSGGAVSRKGGVCNHQLQWFSRSGVVSPESSRTIHDDIKPVGILGPPGSGVLWLRYIIEQLTGYYTGSPETTSSNGIFKGDGHSTKVIELLGSGCRLSMMLPQVIWVGGVAGYFTVPQVLAMMTYKVEQIPSMHSAVLLYRGMRDTVRTRYAETHGGTGLLQATPTSYYDARWQTFAVEESRRWAEAYNSYVRSVSPLLVITHAELSDAHQIQSHLLRLLSFFRVPVKQSTLACVMQRAEAFPLRPQVFQTKGSKSDGGAFEPFDLLAAEELAYLRKLENETETMVEHARTLFRPKV